MVMKNNSKKKIALTCIAKNEDNYIEEWVNYNLKLGFDDIYIYQNNWECPLEHPQVHKIPFNSNDSNRVVHAYNSFVRQFYSLYEYVAFFDVDEFLVLKKHKNVKDFIADYPNEPAIAINWAMFGDNGLTEVTDNNYSVIKRFTKRAKFWKGAEVKCIVKLNEHVCVTAHHPYSSDWASPNKDGVRGTNAHNFQGSYEVAQINHYWTKTLQEFHEKQNGRRLNNLPLDDSKFNYHNENEVEDLWALNFLES